MNIMLTGASGFIGTHVMRELCQCGHRIIALSRKGQKDVSGVRWIRGSLNDWDKLASDIPSGTLDACVHLAWEGIPDYSGEQSARNLQYGLSVLQFCKRLNIGKLVIAGSCWEYAAPRDAVKETAPLSYENSFKTAKNVLHRMAETFCNEYGISMHWLRFFYVYGEGQREASLIPFLAAALREGRQPELKGAFNRNDFVHASDVARAVCASLESMGKAAGTGMFNIGSGRGTLVLDIVSQMADMMGVSLDLSAYGESVGSEPAFWADIGAARSRLGWTPQITLQDGLQRYINSEGNR